MARESAGLVLYRWKAGELFVVLGHMGGPYFAGKDEAAWTIPKGIIGEGEGPLAAALRECEEELGIRPVGTAVPLGQIRQSGGKRVSAWAMEHKDEVIYRGSNVFAVEWPPRSGTLRHFPEIDRAAWFDLRTAQRKAVRGQGELFLRLQRSSAAGMVAPPVPGL